MKKTILLLVFAFGSLSCYSSNLTLSTGVIASKNTTSNFFMVQFNISWDNSWRTSTYESNWDAAWLFLKYRIQGQTTWNHAILNTTGHVAPIGSVINTSSDGVGAFIYKNNDGIGSNSWNNVQLQWNYGTNGLSDSTKIEVCVFAIEMVYVPQGAFYVGDGNTISPRGTFEAGVSGNYFQITSEAAITLGGGGVGSLGNNNAALMSIPSDDFNDVTTQTLPDNSAGNGFPKGYNSFYEMKYEITQEQYVEFLNKLTYDQQTSRTLTAPNSISKTGALVNPIANRNGIEIMIPGINPSTPAVYACNLNNNATFSDIDDGQNIACNWLTWADVVAYLDWAGLRPITELEYEKACRGTLVPVKNEYAWGNTTIIQTTGVLNSGLSTEVASNAGANCLSVSSAGAQGPMRVGCYAKASTDRESSGASYYGIMELSGNVWERAITVGNATGRSFTGAHGDGNLDVVGNANVVNWPGVNATGSSLRGGPWSISALHGRVSDRIDATAENPSRLKSMGGRGVHTAP